MRIEKDFKEFIELLNEHSVRYLVVGGFAYSFHAEPRFTKDIDIFVEGSKENAGKLLKVFAAFGFEDLGLTMDDFIGPGEVVQLGVEPVRIDVMTSITGVDFAPAWENRVSGNYGDVPVYFISKADLILNKAAVGRKQDLSDIDKLQRI
ncbi:MAG: nucleotidyltransferase [Candidatus Aminicenantes bacterium]|nr:nucleotidyltransferase [Candidatus Aminicenantes bacterium]